MSSQVKLLITLNRACNWFHIKPNNTIKCFLRKIVYHSSFTSTFTTYNHWFIIGSRMNLNNNQLMTRPLFSTTLLSLFIQNLWQTTITRCDLKETAYTHVSDCAQSRENLNRANLDFVSSKISNDVVAKVNL